MKDNPNFKESVDKEEAANLMMKIMLAIKEVMNGSGPTVLVFSDAKITIEKTNDEL